MICFFCRYIVRFTENAYNAHTIWNLIRFKFCTHARAKRTTHPKWMWSINYKINANRRSREINAKILLCVCVFRKKIFILTWLDVNRCLWLIVQMKNVITRHEKNSNGGHEQIIETITMHESINFVLSRRVICVYTAKLNVL